MIIGTTSKLYHLPPSPDGWYHRPPWASPVGCRRLRWIPLPFLRIGQKSPTCSAGEAPKGGSGTNGARSCGSYRLSGVSRYPASYSCTCTLGHVRLLRSLSPSTSFISVSTGSFRASSAPYTVPKNRTAPKMAMHLKNKSILFQIWANCVFLPFD